MGLVVRETFVGCILNGIWHSGLLEADVAPFSSCRETVGRDISRQVECGRH